MFWRKSLHNINNYPQIHLCMNCERCGNETDGQKLCPSCKDIIIEQPEKDPEIITNTLASEDKEKLTREELIVVGFGVAGAVFLVGTTMMYIIS